MMGWTTVETTEPPTDDDYLETLDEVVKLGYRLRAASEPDERERYRNLYLAARSRLDCSSRRNNQPSAR
jgi:hypothetical protein